MRAQIVPGMGSGRREGEGTREFSFSKLGSSFLPIGGGPALRGGSQRAGWSAAEEEARAGWGVRGSCWRVHGYDLSEAQHMLGDTFAVLDQQGAPQLQEVGGSVSEEPVELGASGWTSSTRRWLSSGGLVLLHGLVEVSTDIIEASEGGRRY